MSEEGVIPAGLLALALEGAFAGVLFEDGQGDAAEPGEVLGGIAGAGAAGVLAEDHVEDPMDAVLNAPMAADPCGQHLGQFLDAGDVVVRLVAVLVRLTPLAADVDDGLEPLPVGLGAQPRRVVNHRVDPLLLPAVPLLRGVVHPPAQPGEALLLGLLEAGDAVLVQRLLVLLDGQQVLPALPLDQPGDLLLAAHGVAGHDRPLQVEQLQQPGDGRDLVGLLVTGDLAQGDAGLAGPDADGVQAAQPLAAIGAAALGLAVDLQELGPAQPGPDGVDPAGEAVLEGHRAQRGEDPVEGVVAGDAVGQLQEAGQPVLLGVAESLDVIPALRPADDGAQGDDDDVGQLVPPGAADARVGQVGEVRRDGQGRHVAIDDRREVRRLLWERQQQRQLVRAERDRALERQVLWDGQQIDWLHEAPPTLALASPPAYRGHRPTTTLSGTFPLSPLTLSRNARGNKHLRSDSPSSIADTSPLFWKMRRPWGGTGLAITQWSGALDNTIYSEFPDAADGAAGLGQEHLELHRLPQP